MTAHKLQFILSVSKNTTRLHTSSLLSVLLVSVLCLSALAYNHSFGSAASSSRDANQTSPTLQGQKAVDQLKEQGLYSSL
jgi:hypothetical protein